MYLIEIVCVWTDCARLESIVILSRSRCSTLWFNYLSGIQKQRLQLWYNEFRNDNSINMSNQQNILILNYIIYCINFFHACWSDWRYRKIVNNKIFFQNNAMVNISLYFPGHCIYVTEVVVLMDLRFTARNHAKWDIEC